MARAAKFPSRSISYVVRTVQGRLSEALSAADASSLGSNGADILGSIAKVVVLTIWASGPILRACSPNPGQIEPEYLGWAREAEGGFSPSPAASDRADGGTGNSDGSCYRNPPSWCRGQETRPRQRITQPYRKYHRQHFPVRERALVSSKTSDHSAVFRPSG